MGAEPTEEPKGKTVSYSQFKLWTECPYEWKLRYVDKHRTESGNIWSLLGTSLHEVIQDYLTTLYGQTIKAADAMDLDALLLTRLQANFESARDGNEGIPICTYDEIMESYVDGLAIIKELKSKRGDYFPKKGVELLGIELPLKVEVRENLYFTGFIDVILKDDDMIRIIDIKIANKGWNAWKKKDEARLAQLRLYKKFYSELYNVPMPSIVVEYVIFKRKLYDNVDFPQKRIQHFKPSQGRPSINASYALFESFLDACFDTNGDYATGAVHKKNPAKFNCSFCPYGPKGNMSHLCDQDGVLVEIWEPPC